jgi:hypothetical protein
MRKRVLLFCGFVALGATVALAAVLGFAGTSKAAGRNICTVVNGTADCFKVSVDPIFVTSGQTGKVTATFNNSFGNATATHTVISVTLSNTTALAISGTGRPAACSLATLSCDFGNVPNGIKVQVTVRFQNSVSANGTISASGTLTFAESNSTSPTSDTVTIPATAPSVSGTDHGGYCTIEKTKVVKNKVVPLLSATDISGQSATIENLAALTGVICTPIAAGVEEAPGNSGLTTNVSIVAFQATGTVTLLFPLDADTTVSNFHLKELSIDGTGQWIPLNPCANPPVFPDPPGTDSCIKSETTVTKSGTKYIQDVLLVQGSPPDGHYGG